MSNTGSVPFRASGRQSSNGRSRARGLQRWGAVIGAGALAIYGLTRRSKLGWAMAASGGALAYTVFRSNPGARESMARSSILLNCTPEQAFRFWRDFTNLPLFMRHLESVAITDSKRSRWTAIGPMGAHVTWNAEIVNEHENEFISWHSLPGSDLMMEGFVDFRQAPANRGTILTATIRYHSPAGALGAKLVKLLGKDPSFLMEQDLRRMKALIETGEIPTTDGQSHGARDLMTGAARLMNPDEPVGAYGGVREALSASRRIS